jgi:hypothetical protein
MKPQNETPTPETIRIFKQEIARLENRMAVNIKLKGRTRLIEVELTNIAWNLKYIYETIEGEDLAESITDLIDELTANVNQAIDKAVHLKNVLKWDGHK